MRILSVSHYYPPHVGGLEVVAKKQVDSLAKEGHDVSVVTGAIPGRARGYERECAVDVYRERVWNVFDLYFGIPFPVVGFGMMSRILAEVRKADAVHIHDVFYMTSWFAAIFAAIMKRPIILTQHVGVVDHKSRVVVAIQRLVYFMIGRSIFRLSKNILVYNANVRAFLESQCIDMRKVIELRNGIDLSMFNDRDRIDIASIRRSYGIPLDIPVALFVGRFVSKKGFDALYGARADGYHIVFAGPGAVPSRWKNDPRVTFIGPLTHDELARLYRAVDVFVFPATGEIFTLVMQEAMASGLPIITTDDPGYRKYPVDRDLIRFVRPDSESLASAMTEVLRDRSLAKRMRDYSVSLAREWFDWYRNILPVIDIYARIRTERYG